MVRVPVRGVGGNVLRVRGQLPRLMRNMSSSGDRARSERPQGLGDGAEQEGKGCQEGQSGVPNAKGWEEGGTI